MAIVDLIDFWMEGSHVIHEDFEDIHSTTFVKLANQRITKGVDGSVFVFLF